MKDLKLAKLEKKEDNKCFSQTPGPQIDLMIEAITCHMPSQPKVQLYLKIQDIGLQPHPTFKYQTKATSGLVLGNVMMFEWLISKSLGFTNPTLSITIFQQNTLWANKVVAEAIIPLHNILAHFLSNPNTGDIDFTIALQPGHTISLIFAQKSLQDVLQRVQLCKTVIQKLKKTTEGLEVLFSPESVLSRLASLAHPIMEQIVHLCDKLQNYEIAPIYIVKLIETLQKGLQVVTKLWKIFSDVLDKH
ncbi:hypothetical protein BDN72DRAFT_902842 [Pluteus cervinus]|uniref:Uncharacterized protein n=1 Tax=Pluteus cervinus TaxID=181527 RepID=A0ACD3AB59_9AGAR|nr:hypothetical protein BDN72DRAFT_902842 [Pluteus cervinus]